MATSCTTQKTAPAPLLQWAGGKRRLLPELLGRIPAFSGRYYEPFFGGGALYWALADTVAGDHCVIGDCLDELTGLYRVVRNEPDKLITELTKLAALPPTGETYYWVRDEWTPPSPAASAARTLYLNRTGFNGLYRTNSSGRYNVTWGRKERPYAVPTELIQADGARLCGTTIRTGAAWDAVADAQAGDFVYLDPPYHGTHTAYSAGGFGEDAQRQLAGTVAELTELGVLVLLSNSDTPFTRQVFGEVLDLETVSVHRSISRSVASRGTVSEILGNNFGAVAGDRLLAA